MNDDQRRLRRWLRAERDRFQLQPGMLYRGPADFVLCHGEWMTPAAVMPMMPSQCYQNAIIGATYKGWTYVEGYTVSPDRELLARNKMAYKGDEVVQHAWCVDGSGKVIEMTWPAPGRAYRGVPFAVGRADDATWNGDATVLDDFHRGHPLLREAWVGEDWTRHWEPTEGMLMTRVVIEATKPELIVEREARARGYERFTV